MAGSIVKQIDGERERGRHTPRDYCSSCCYVRNVRTPSNLQVQGACTAAATGRTTTTYIYTRRGNGGHAACMLHAGYVEADDRRHSQRCRGQCSLETVAATCYVRCLNALVRGYSTPTLLCPFASIHGSWTTGRPRTYSYTARHGSAAVCMHW